MRIKRKPVIHNVHILDASGSMSGPKYINALKGINAEQCELQKVNNARYTQSVLEFRSSHSGVTEIIEHSFMRPMKICETITGRGAMGGTPLYEAVGAILDKLLLGMEAGDKVLVKIFTDGEENTSKGIYADGSKLKELVLKCENNGFTVVFIGTEGDVYNVVKNLGIHMSNTYMHLNTPESISVSYNAMAFRTTNYASRTLKGQGVTMDFFAQEDKEEAK